MYITDKQLKKLMKNKNDFAFTIRVEGDFSVSGDFSTIVNEYNWLKSKLVKESEEWTPDFIFAYEESKLLFELYNCRNDKAFYITEEQFFKFCQKLG